MTRNDEYENELKGDDCLKYAWTFDGLSMQKTETGRWFVSVVVAGRLPVVTTGVTGEHRCVSWLLVVIKREEKSLIGLFVIRGDRCLLNKDDRKRKRCGKEHGVTLWRWSSNQVALDVAGQEVVDPVRVKQYSDHIHDEDAWKLLGMDFLIRRTLNGYVGRFSLRSDHRKRTHQKLTPLEIKSMYEEPSKSEIKKAEITTRNHDQQVTKSEQKSRREMNMPEKDGGGAGEEKRCGGGWNQSDLKEPVEGRWRLSDFRATKEVKCEGWSLIYIIPTLLESSEGNVWFAERWTRMYDTINVKISSMGYLEIEGPSLWNMELEYGTQTKSNIEGYLPWGLEKQSNLTSPLIDGSTTAPKIKYAVRSTSLYMTSVVVFTYKGD
ncbi:hypothetical protein LXL04_011677 [Taraxacum kok-saghyz]